VYAQIWASDPPYYHVCRADCEPTVSYRVFANASDCQLCGQAQCVLGDQTVPCTPSSDVACVACPLLTSDFLEFAVAGECGTRCISGFYADPLNLYECIPCAGIVPPDMGFYVSTPNCRLPEERLSKPLFLPCQLTIPNYTWVKLGACETGCSNGYILFEGLCQLCQPSFCGGNLIGECTIMGTLVCTPPPSLLVSCEVGFLLSSNGCVASKNTATAVPNKNQNFPRGGVAHPELQYPHRRQTK
jgi:hypothetical protein